MTQSMMTPGAFMPTAPGMAPVSSQVKPTTPQDADRFIVNRVLPSNLDGGASTSGIAAMAFAPVAPPAPSIVDLAEALDHDVDKIYRYVKNNIAFLPVWGSQKGAYTCLVDKLGGSFDQAALMIALLRESGFDITESQFVKGKLRLTAAQAVNWLGIDVAGTDFGTIERARDLLGAGGIASANTEVSPDDYRLDVDHVYVSVKIGSTWYMFDPAFKTHTISSGIGISNLATHMGWDSSAFQAACLSGSSSTADYYQNINTNNMKAKLDEMTADLVDWIKNNAHDSSLEDLIGSTTIVAETGVIRDTTNPNQSPASTTLWTAIPDSYKSVLTIVYDTINISFKSEEIAGKRLTLFFNGSNQAELRLDGVLKGTSSAQGQGTWNSVGFTVTHPYSGFDQPLYYQRVWAGKSYLIGNAWGNSSPELGYLHQRLLSDKLDAGGVATAEDVLGESLCTIWHTWSAQKSLMMNMIGRLNKCSAILHHQVGLVGHFDTPFVDLGSIRWAAAAIDGNSTRITATDAIIALRGIGFESNTINQLPGITAMSSDTMMFKANNSGSNGQKLYFAHNGNWSGQGGVRDILDATYDADVLDAMELRINQGHKILAHENGDTAQEGYTGHGYFILWSGGGASGIIGGGLNGGSGTTPQAPSDTNNNTRNNMPPDDKLDKVEVDYIVDTYSGNFMYRNTDLSVGSGEFPHRLPFTRSFNTKDRNTMTNMGMGWRHNWMISAVPGTDPYAALGKYAAIPSAPHLVHTIMAILTLGTTNQLQWTLVALSIDFPSKKLNGNVINVRDGEKTYTFSQFQDGTYAPPKGVSLGIARVTGTPDKYVMESFEGVKWTFPVAGTGNVEKIEYPEGVTLTFAYSGPFTDNHVVSVTASTGYALYFEYNAIINTLKRVSLTSPSSGEYYAEYTIDGTGHLTSFMDRAFKQTTYLYDSKHRMTRYTLPNQTSIDIEYDSQDRVKTMQNPKGITSFTFTGEYSISSSADRFVITQFNSDGKPLYVSDGGIETWHSYDGLGREISTRFAENNQIQTEYDLFNRVTKKIYVDKSGTNTLEELFGYDAGHPSGKWTQFTNKRGKITNRTYHETKRLLLEEKAPELTPGNPATRPTKTWTYTGSGRLETFTDPTGIVTKYVYSGSERDLVQIIHDFGTGRLNLTTSFIYDGLVGNPTTETNPRGKTTTIEYDPLRRVTKRTSPTPFEYETKFLYDAVGNLTREEREVSGFPTWQQTDRTYSATNKVLSVKDPNGNITINTYNGLDLLTESLDAENRLTKYEYDLALRLKKVIDPANVTAEERTYTPNGQLATIKDANGNVSTYAYDGWDRKTRLTYPDGSYENWTLDANGNATTYRSRSVDTATQEFDSNDRLTKRTPQGQAEVRYFYDLAGRLTSVETDAVAGNPATGVFTRTYDTAGRLIKEKNSQNQEVVYTLDANGNVTRIDYPSTPSFYIEKFYDEMDRLTSVKLNGTTTLATYTWDELSRSTSLTFGNGVSHSYTRDLGGRLLSSKLSFTGGPSATWAYRYNRVNQMTRQACTDPAFLWKPTALSQAYAHNDLNQYTTIGGVTVNHNTDGCVTGTSDSVWSFSYDFDNMLTSATKSGVTVTFDYDPHHRQARKNASTTRRYVYSGDQLIAEYDNSNSLVQRFVYGFESDDPIAQITAGGTITYLHQNHVGSIVATSNTSGAFVNKYAYSPFGESGSLSGTTFGFTGQRFDTETGLYHFKARYFSPAWGRFLQTDPKSYDDGLHLYAYVKNDPLNLTDPTGQYAEVETKKKPNGRTEVTITIPIEYSGKKPENGWAKQVHDSWSGVFGPYDVTTNIKETSEKKRNRIEVVDFSSEPHVLKNYTGVKDGENQRDREYTGVFAKNFGTWDPSHEVGHLMGLPDMYNTAASDRRSAKPLQKTFGGEALGLMGTGDKVLEPYIKRIVDGSPYKIKEYLLAQ